MTHPSCRPRRRTLWIVAAIAVALSAGQSRAVRAEPVEQVVFKRDGREQTVAGKLLVRAQDGGLMLVDATGAYWMIQPGELVSRTTTKNEFKPLSSKQMEEKLLDEFPDFHVHTTDNYVICYNTTRQYAVWCGSLFERLRRAFTNYWDRAGIEMHRPDFPLVAIVFADQASYFRYAQPEIGAAAQKVVGYYSLQSNRMTMYDLTGVQAILQAGDIRSSRSDINVMLSRPQAVPLVSTIIHEATHQVAFNSGMHERFADIPLWVSEGLAMYFETPDLTSASGWRGIGAVNVSRLTTFQRGLVSGRLGSLESLVATDDRMRNLGEGANAYAEAWALCYYLIRRKPREFAAYLSDLSEKKPMFWDQPEERLEAFEDHLDASPAEIQNDFLRFMQNIR